MPTTTCPKCRAVFDASKPKCPICDHHQEPKKPENDRGKQLLYASKSRAGRKRFLDD
jgi:hypothetical protein